MNKIASLLVFLFIIVSCSCYDIHYQRKFDCLNITKGGCQLWNDTVDLLMYSSLYGYMCFPQQVHVLTENGPQSIDQISVGDKILSYNFDNNKHEYSPILAWLHRDTTGSHEYNQIITKSGSLYLSSWGHNIAYITNEGSIGFKYATDLRDGDSLVSIGEPQIVNSSSEKVYEAGRYAPYTKLGNFYIFPENSELNDQSKMILVHCLSQVHTPRSLEPVINSYLTVSGLLGLNTHKNTQSEEYLHPVASFLSVWTSNPLTVKSDGNHMLHQKGSSSSRSSSSRSSSRSSRSSSRSSRRYGYGTISSSSSNRQQQRNQRIIILLGFTSMMQTVMYNY